MKNLMSVHQSNIDLAPTKPNTAEIYTVASEATYLRRQGLQREDEIYEFPCETFHDSESVMLYMEWDRCIS